MLMKKEYLLPATGMVAAVMTGCLCNVSTTKPITEDPDPVGDPT